MDSSAEPGASFVTSKLLWAKKGPFPPNSGPICGSRQRKSGSPKSPRPSTSVFEDIERIIDEPEWEAFHEDLSSSDFERVRVVKQEPEACSDEDGEFLAYGSGTRNGGKRKRSENSLPDHADSRSPQHNNKRVKTETEQSMETCEREKDRDLEILALAPIGLNVHNCSVKTEGVALNSNSYAVCAANSDVRKLIKQEPEWSGIHVSPVPTLDSENQSRIALNGNCDRGMAESVQDSAINNRVSAIVSEKLSLKQEPLEECTDPDARAFTASDSDSAHCNSIAEGVISPISKLDSEQDSLLSNNASDAVLSSYVKVELITEDSIANYPVQLSDNEIEHKNFDLFPKDNVPSTDPNHDGNMVAGSFAKDRIPTSIAKIVRVAGKPFIKILGFESDKCQNTRGSSRSKAEKDSHKEHSDNDKFFPKVSSEDGDNSDEDFEPDEQPSDNDDGVEIVKLTPLPYPYADLITDELLLEEIVRTVKSNPLYKPFWESELESLAPEVLRLWKTEGFMNFGVKSIISRYIKQEPKYLQIIKTYVYDGIDEDAIRSLPLGFYYESKRINLRVKCPVCSKTLMKLNFENHMNCHANGRPHMCEKCGRTYVSEGDLIKHEKESGCSGKRFECKVCGKVCGDKGGLRRHEKLHHSKTQKHKCHVCDAVFDLPASLEEHMVCHANDKDSNCHDSQIHVEEAPQPNQCKKCNAKFESWYQYQKHINQHNKSTEKPLQCPHCDKCFAVHSTLKDHIRTHTGEKPHKCDICGHAFARKSTMNKHRLTHQDKGLYRCDICGHAFAQKSAMDSHKLTHQDKLYRCDICGHEFAQKSYMNCHRLTHQDKRLYRCEKCGKAYRTKTTLHTHLRESTCSDKRFECKVCGKVYGCKPGLRFHEKLHDPNREMYECHVCDAVFASTSALRDHVARHGNAEDPSQLTNPFQCHDCGKHFSTKRNLNRHYSQIHLEKARQPK